MAAKRKIIAPPQRTNIVLVLDDSASMAGIAQEAHIAFGRWTEKIRKSARDSKQYTLMSIIKFGSRVDVLYSHMDSDVAGTIECYSPNQGSTALFDAVTRAVKLLDDVPSADKFNDSFMILVVTDGQENSSDYQNIRDFPRLAKKLQNTDKWTFAFMLPPGNKRSFCSTYGIPEGNVTEWEQTRQGVRDAEVLTSCSFDNYYAARTLNQTSVKNFFVQPDLSKVRHTDVAKKLDDVSGECEQFTLAKEAVIKDFVEAKTKRPYKLGSTYYQLMKSEKVQANKDVMLVEKGKPYVWAGRQARDLIGLPSGADAKVEPGNHANYDIYIQSTSVNRKLPRGTKIIVRN